MKTKMVVSYTGDSLAPLTRAQKAHLKALAERPESEIDLKDSAELSADVLEWLKGQGKGYQSGMNAILRREMPAAS
jgi:uncharacterized protein (DUF4415 family)